MICKPVHTSLLLMPLLLLASSKGTTEEPSSALDAVSGAAHDGLAAVGHGGGGVTGSLGPGDGRGHVAAVLVFALALGAVDALLGREVRHGLQEASLADLGGGDVVHAVLEGVDLLDARDLGLV